jgi:hypothetical protein
VTLHSLLKIVLLITSRHGLHRKHSSHIVAFVSVAAGTCLPSSRPVTAAGPPQKTRSSHVASVNVAGIAYQQPMFIESPLNNGSIYHTTLSQQCSLIYNVTFPLNRTTVT